jgi:hypothetical protein
MWLSLRSRRGYLEESCLAKYCIPSREHTLSSLSYKTSVNKSWIDGRHQMFQRKRKISSEVILKREMMLQTSGLAPI